MRHCSGSPSVRCATFVIAVTQHLGNRPQELFKCQQVNKECRTLSYNCYTVLQNFIV